MDLASRSHTQPLTLLNDTPLTSLENLTYHSGIIGCGYSFKAVLERIIQEYKSVYEDATQNRSTLRMVHPPILDLTVFGTEAPGSQVFSSVHPDIDAYLSSNTGRSCASIFGAGVDYFSAWPDASTIPNDPATKLLRSTQGNLNQWELEQSIATIAEHNLPIRIHRIPLNITAVDQIPGYCNQYVCTDTNGTSSRSFDSLILATGHSENDSVQVTGHTEHFVRNFYSEYNKLQHILDSKPKNLIIAGGGQCGRELLKILMLQGYDEPITLVLPNLFAELPLLKIGLTRKAPDPFFRYLENLYRNGKLTFQTGHVREFHGTDSGAILIETTTGEEMTVHGTLVMGSPFKDGIKEDGFSRQPLIASMQEHGIVPRFDPSQHQLIDEFGRAYSAATYPPVANEDILIVGRSASATKAFATNTSLAHARVAGQTLVQHAIYTGWKKLALNAHEL